MQSDVQQIQAGWAVYDVNDDKVADVSDVGANYVMVTKGLIFLKDLYIPFDEIRNVDPARECLFLNVAKDEIESMGWDQVPDETSSGYGASSQAANTFDTNTVDTTTTTTTSTSGGYGATDSGRSDIRDAGATDAFRVPVHEEELQAEKRSTQAGEVQVGKRVVEEQRDLEVPVTREEVNVRRVNVDRDATGNEDAFTDGDTIRVPVQAEEVEVTKRPRVREEIEISKRPVTEKRRVSDTVRREEVDVRDDNDVLNRTDDRELTGAGSGTSYTEGDRDWQADADQRRTLGVDSPDVRDTER